MRAEYDRKNNRVVQVEMDDGRKVPTESPRVLGSETDWLDVDIEYPEDYHPRFHTLLNANSIRYDYDEKTDKVIIRYPDSDFSNEAIRNRLRQMIRERVRILLGETDWAVIRRLDTGKDIPPAVATEREMYRDRADSLEAALDNTSDDDLLDFDFTFDYSKPGKVRATKTVVEGGDGQEWLTTATSPEEKGEPIRPAVEIGHDPDRNPAPTIVENPNISEGEPVWAKRPEGEDK